jgi:hypothetical protein
MTRGRLTWAGVANMVKTGVKRGSGEGGVF